MPVLGRLAHEHQMLGGDGKALWCSAERSPAEAARRRTLRDFATNLRGRLVASVVEEDVGGGAVIVDRTVWARWARREVVCFKWNDRYGMA